MTSGERQILVFQVGEEQFAADISRLREIASWQPVRRIPRAPAFLAGVVDLRNREIIPIIDLHDRLDLPLNVPEQKQRIIIAPVDRQFVGFLVDAVRDVLTVQQDQIAAPPAVGEESPAFLSGVLRTDDGIILLIDTEQILTSDEKLRIAELKESLATNQSSPSATSAEDNSSTKRKRASSTSTGNKKTGAKAARKTKKTAARKPGKKRSSGSEGEK
ncbi:MAG: hypothetical protein D6761_03720 [Candidatus Dadabacteria bacterium]|nr:MAG: hypothetical protein D6761_03720 [Candidatus Dadabacteria bacterium]